MTKETKIFLYIIGAILILLILRYIQYRYNINWVEKNWSKINFDQNVPEPHNLPMGGVRVWRLEGGDINSGHSVDGVNLRNTFPFYEVLIQKKQDGTFIVR